MVYILAGEYVNWLSITNQWFFITINTDENLYRKNCQESKINNIHKNMYVLKIKTTYLYLFVFSRIIILNNLI